MRKPNFIWGALLAAFCAGLSSAQVDQDIGKACDVVSAYFPVAGKAAPPLDKLEYRLGWNKKPPYRISVQFTNLGYAGLKIRFALRDVTSKKALVLDAARNSPVVTENVGPASAGAVWSGRLDNLHDRCSLRVWDMDGGEWGEKPVGLQDLK